MIVDRRIAPRELERLVAMFFEDMVKYVVDVDRGVAAVGGELHADAEALLLEAGSAQRSLWGANYYPRAGEDECIEYTSLINIRPGQGNRSMEVQDPALRARIRELDLRPHRPGGAVALTQHSDLTLERWRTFDRDRQILMIGNEMHRGSRLREPEALRRCYERVLRLADLTAEAADRPTFRRELLRWRDGVAELYLAARPDSERHRQLLHCLLLMSKEAARQRPYLLS